MPKRISWKKGMRLTDEVLRTADDCTAEYINQAMSLAAIGRFGLIPTLQPFQLQLSITKGFVDVEALSCTAITRGGILIDVHYDTKFTNTIDGRVQIPNNSDETEYMLTINVRPGNWQDTTDGYMEPEYFFGLVSPKTAVPEYGLPIGRIIYEDGWREDNVNFVPPCLCIAAHLKYLQLYQQFVQMMQQIDDTTRQQTESAAVTALSIFWPVVREQLITANTSFDTMTPQQLQACVQKVVSAFTVACHLDELINLEDAETFRKYSTAPFSYRTGYLRIKQGLGMCYAINEKVGKFSLLVKEKPKEPEPVVETPQPTTPPPPPPSNSRRFWDGKQI